MRLDEATVLVVDDEILLLRIFALWLERIGCRVFTAANGVEALKILQENGVDALISDLQMPVMDGLSMVRSIHAGEGGVPITIFVSGFCRLDPREIHALGVEALLEKPLKRQDLIYVLERSLMEREELWLTPIEGEIDQDMAMEFASLEGALRAGEFVLGRGGCCIARCGDLEVGKTLNLVVRFALEGMAIRAQGDVRWYNAAERRGGVEFRYLEPSCRDWVTEQIRGTAPRSYIPAG